LLGHRVVSTVAGVVYTFDMTARAQKEVSRLAMSTRTDSQHKSKFVNVAGNEEGEGGLTGRPPSRDIEKSFCTSSDHSRGSRKPSCTTILRSPQIFIEGTTFFPRRFESHLALTNKEAYEKKKRPLAS
jgi:hypothetical protein